MTPHGPALSLCNRARQETAGPNFGSASRSGNVAVDNMERHRAVLGTTHRDKTADVRVGAHETVPRRDGDDGRADAGVRRPWRQGERRAGGTARHGTDRACSGGGRRGFRRSLRTALRVGVPSGPSLCAQSGGCRGRGLRGLRPGAQCHPRRRRPAAGVPAVLADDCTPDRGRRRRTGEAVHPDRGAGDLRAARLLRGPRAGRSGGVTGRARLRRTARALADRAVVHRGGGRESGAGGATARVVRKRHRRTGEPRSRRAAYGVSAGALVRRGLGTGVPQVRVEIVCVSARLSGSTGSTTRRRAPRRVPALFGPAAGAS